MDFAKDTNYKNKFNTFPSPITHKKTGISYTHYKQINKLWSD